MKQQKTVESRVLEILKECPMSRYDDMLLILHYYNRYGYIPAGNLPLEDIVFNYRAYGLPCFETIRRARQRVQSLFPEYSRNPQKEEQSGSISIVINITDAENAAEFDAYVAKCKELSLYDTGVSAEYGDKLISLSTCEYSRSNGRLVVVAKRVD